MRNVRRVAQVIGVEIYFGLVPLNNETKNSHGVLQEVHIICKEKRGAFWMKMWGLLYLRVQIARFDRLIARNAPGKSAGEAGVIGIVLRVVGVAVVNYFFGKEIGNSIMRLVKTEAHSHFFCEKRYNKIW